MRFGSTTDVTLVEVDTVALFGETTVVKTFLTGGLLITEVSLSDKFGPAAYFTPGEPPGLRFTKYNVTGCILNGKRYPPLPTSVGEKEASTVPEKPQLLQNYPIPFNPATNIQYAVSKNQFVSLKVYDVRGKEVATLVNEKKPAGVYHVSFDAKNFSSGVYFYRLLARDFVKTQKMLVTR